MAVNTVWRPGSTLTSGKLIQCSPGRGLRAATGDEEQGGEGDFAVLYCDIFLHIRKQLELDLRGNVSEEKRTAVRLGSRRRKIVKD